MRAGWFTFVVGAVLVALVSVAAGCGGSSSSTPGESPTSSTAYKGHESDIDMQNFCTAYPGVIGTRLDDCQTCHTGGDVSDGVDTDSLNPCSFCHLIAYPDPDIVSGAPSNYQDTLNPYGLEYLAAGRSASACTAIAGNDSDGDTHSNESEIAAGRYPGDDSSMPGQSVAPIYTFEWADIAALTSHTQFLLMNSHRQQFDDYVNYEGVKVKDLLAAAGVNLAGATGVTIIAPDGYAKDFTLAEVDTQYPDGVYYANLDPASFLDPNQGFVTYPVPAQVPPGLTDGGPIPGEQWMVIAHHRDGGLLDPSYLDPVSGKIDGEGPYRVIIPQVTPGSPDRGSKYSPTGYGDGWDYDDLKDHNAGLCVRGVVAIRVNPMPPGFEEFDWRNGGWALATAGSLILYGQGVTGN